ncbi:hypothetical protein QVD17_11150 [Tagetes erecta]|uniref:Uncharacterized protein n=1 Tax=Tagetes erecta TaxID=13708 RepID=A0AAD8L7Q3_TARER|nr:hypothetical protein QVD17_11150 [Tagetes erecta]
MWIYGSDPRELVDPYLKVCGSNINTKPSTIPSFTSSYHTNPKSAITSNPKSPLSSNPKSFNLIVPSAPRILAHKPQHYISLSLEAPQFSTCY